MASQPMMLLLERITATDKDFRYMATSDLLNELQKDTFRVDNDTERKLCTAMVNQLEDPSGDISGLAVRCLGLLARKAGEQRAQTLVTSLCDKATADTKKEAARDVASIALKTIINEVQGLPMAVPLAQIITQKMLASIKQANVDVVNDSLDVLSEVVDKVGSALTSEHVVIRDALLPFLDDARAPVRKRALQCLGFTGLYLNDEQLTGCVGPIQKRLSQGGMKADFVRTYVQALGHISRTVGYRIGRFLAEVVPLIITCCNKAGETDDELREYCLQALEGCVTHVPVDSKPHVDAMLGLALALLKYDPNFADDTMEEDEDQDQDDEEGDSDDEGYSDDEDMSWKVRRAAVKLLTSLVLTYPDLLPSLYASMSGELVSRFREREESVRTDVFVAYHTLAKQIGTVAGRYAPDDAASPMSRLATHVPEVVRQTSRQLKERSLKSRVGCLQLLRELAAVVPKPVAEQLANLLPGVIAALNDKSSAASTLKIEALMFLRAVLAAGPQGAAANTKQLKELTTAVLPCASDKYYKVAAEAVRVLEQLVLVLRPSGEVAPAPLDGIPLPALFSALQERLSAPDQDQEVKEAAISATATAVARCSDLLGPDLPNTLRMLLERLKNEITRLAAVRAFSTLAASPMPVDLVGPGILEPVVLELTSFLRKALRPLRLAALLSLEALCSKYGTSIPPALMASITDGAAPLVSESDLSLAAQALKTVSVLLRAQPQPAPSAAGQVLPAALQLVQSPLLQGAALDQLNSFLTALAATNTPGASVDDLLQALITTGRTVNVTARSAQLAVAQCVSVLASAAGASKVADTAQALLADVNASKPVLTQRLALLCLGELGRRVDLHGLPQVEAAISSSMSADNEDIKGAASLALGGVACGNLNQYMPSLLRQIQSAPGPKQQYLLLTALNEVLITCNTPPQQQPGADATPLPQLSPGDQAAVLSLLLGSAGTAQEEVKAAISECLGRLALLHPVEVISQLQSQLQHANEGMRAVVVSSLKYMVTERPHPIDAHLATSVQPFLALMSDPQHNVRRSTVVSLSAIAHQKPGIVAGSREGAEPPLLQVMPAVYAQTEVRQELIRTVDLGPFKHQIDDGLELRKAAFECLDILLDSSVCAPLLDMHTFIRHLMRGLGDHVDIKGPCHLMMCKVCSVSPVAVLAEAENLVGPLEGTLTTKLKEAAVQQEVDRHEELLRGCLRVVHAVAQLPGMEACAPFQAFMKRTVLTGPMKDRYTQVQREWADGAADHMDIN